MGHRPLVELIQEVPNDRLDEGERYWITHFRRKGEAQLNARMGGRDGKFYGRVACILPPFTYQALQRERQRCNLGDGISQGPLIISMIQTCLGIAPDDGRTHSMPAYETIYLRVPPELKDWLREEADREHTTMQDLIIQGVERLRLERATQKPAKPQAAEARSRT